MRRTDKVGTEAAFHPIEEYMVHVEDHFQHLARRMLVDKKRVYLATDDPSLLQEAKAKCVYLAVCACVSVCTCVSVCVCVYVPPAVWVCVSAGLPCGILDLFVMTRSCI